jgi:hypothetical protein
MENLPPDNLLSNSPIVTAIFPGTNVSVNKNIGDVTVTASGGGGGGTQTKVVTNYNGNVIAPVGGGIYTTISTLVVTLTAPSIITLTYGFAIHSDALAFLNFQVVVNGVVYASNDLKLDLNDELSSATLSYWYRATAVGTYTIVFRVTNAGPNNPDVSNIYSTALSNLNG